MSPISIWLLPSDADRTALSQLVQAFGQVVNSPVFDPHVTVLGNIETPIDKLNDALALCAANIGRIALTVTGIAGNSERFTSFFIAFRESDELTNLISILSQKLNIPGSKSPAPHLSLIYPLRPLDDVDRKKLSTLAKIAQAYDFDSICAVSPQNRVIGWNDVSSWRIVSSFHFRP